MIARKEIKLTANVQSTTSELRYSYTSSSSSPDLITDTVGNTVQRNVSLPGGVNLNLNSNQTDVAKQRTYSIPNFHGDTMITTDYNGAKTGVYTYDPFGNQLDSVVPPQLNSPPGTTYGYLGSDTRLTETPYSVPITQMGDRIYLPGLGRFMQPDSVEGGNANAYIYPADPVNGRDVDGNFAWFAPLVWFVVRAVVVAVVSYVVGKIIEKVVPQKYQEPAKTAVEIASYFSVAKAATTLVSKVPAFVPIVQKEIKNVYKSQEFKSTIEFGKTQHREFMQKMSDPNENVFMVHANGKRGFADAITRTDVFELKPDNTRAIGRGLSQLKQYSETTRLNGQLWVYGSRLGQFNCVFGCTP